MAKLLLVEDHTLFRAGIRALLEKSDSEHTFVGEASDGRTAAKLAAELLPDIVLMDVSMPGLNGIEATHLIRKSSPDSRIVMLSMHADPAYVFAALDAGAHAYVLKDAAFGELEAAIRSVLSDQKFLSAGLRGITRTFNRAPATGYSALNALSTRERQILQLIAEAYSSPEIAKKLTLRVRTIETYRQRMMDKLDLHSVAALTAFAIKHGLTSTIAADQT